MTSELVIGPESERCKPGGPKITRPHSAHVSVETCGSCPSTPTSQSCYMYTIQPDQPDQLWATELAELSRLLSSKPEPELDRSMHFWFTDLMDHYVRTIFSFAGDI
jgi:hypothetical protein